MTVGNDKIAIVIVHNKCTGSGSVFHLPHQKFQSVDQIMVARITSLTTRQETNAIAIFSDAEHGRIGVNRTLGTREITHTHKLFRLDYFRLFFRLWWATKIDLWKLVQTVWGHADAQNGRIVYFSTVEKKTLSFIAFAAEKRKIGFICAVGYNFSRNTNFASQWMKCVCSVAQISLICLLVVHGRNFE